MPKTAADAAARVPVFESDHGLLLLGPLGFCRAVGDLNGGTWVPAKHPETALPAVVNPRGKSRGAEEYLIALAGGWALRVRHSEIERGRHYRYAFVRLPADARQLSKRTRGVD